MAASKRPAPVTPLGASVRLQFPERVEAVLFDEPYAPLSISIWCNPPSKLLQDTPLSTALPTFLTQFVRDWNVVGEDGARLPVTEDNLAQLPIDVQSQLVVELQMRSRRARVRPDPSTGAANS